MNPGAAPSTETVVIGLGSPDNGDDAIGPVVAAAVAELGIPGLRVLSHEDPTALIHLWEGASHVIVIDAIVSGRTPGSLVVTQAGRSAPPLPESAWAATGRGGTHAFGLATAIALARTLGRLPEHLVIVGVEAASVEHGTSLSPVVEAARPEAIARVVAEVGGHAHS